MAIYSRTILTAAALVLAVTAIPPSNGNQGPPPNSLNTKILKYIELSKRYETVDKAIEGSFSYYERENMSISKEEWQAAKKKAKAKMLEALIGVIAKHFTSDDVDGLNQFYSTDLGKKVAASGTPMAEELMAAQDVIVRECITEKRQAQQKLLQKS